MEKTPFFYNPETKWLHSGGQHEECPLGGVGIALFEKIRKNAEKGLICQISAETGKEETYEEFKLKCIKIALYMRDEGLKPGDIISICSVNNENNLAVLLAGLYNGITLAPTDPLTTLADSKYLLGLVEPKLMFVCQKSIEVSTKATEGRGVKIVTLYEHEFLDSVQKIMDKYTLENINSFVPYYADDLNETISIQFSSGTTGMPKASCFSHHMVFENTKNDMLPGTRGSIFTTLFWSTTTLFDTGLLMSGGTRVYVTNVSPETLWDNLQKAKTNVAFISYGFCMQCIPYLKQSLPNLRKVIIAGGMLPERYLNELQEKLPQTLLFRVYGATELGCLFYNAGQSPPESAGYMIPKDTITKIVDLETEQPVDLNVLGEIRVKRKYQLTKYYKRDTTDIWDDEGFYKTGDVGYLNDKFDLFVVDRIKEMFKYRGYHVIPEKIERVLLAHPAVKLAIVIPVCHLTDDSHAKGLVVLAEGSSVNEEELVKFTNERIEDSRDHLLGGVQIITDGDVSYTATRKISRRPLKLRFGN